MPLKEFFCIADDGVIEMVSRAEGGGSVGDSFDRIRPGQDITWPKGLTYNALKEAGSGVLEIADDGSFKIFQTSRDSR